MQTSTRPLQSGTGIKLPTVSTSLSVAQQEEDRLRKKREMNEYLSSRLLTIPKLNVTKSSSLPLQTDFKTLNDIRRYRPKIVSINPEAKFQPWNQVQSTSVKSIARYPPVTKIKQRIPLTSELMVELQRTFKDLKQWSPTFFESKYRISLIDRTKCSFCIELVSKGLQDRQIVIEIADKEWLSPEEDLIGSLDNKSLALLEMLRRGRYDHLSDFFTGDIMATYQESDIRKQSEKITEYIKTHGVSEEIANYDLFRAKIFRPTLVLAITEFFFQNYTNMAMLDPLVGSGNRLLGALADKQISEYIGFESDPNLTERYHEIYRTFQSQSSLTSFAVHNQSYQNANMAEMGYQNRFDLILTSLPSAFDKWHSLGTSDVTSELRSIADFGQLVEEWKLRFLYPVMNNNSQVLRDGGLMIINLNSTDIDGHPIDLITPLFEAVQQTDAFSYVGMVAFSKRGPGEVLRNPQPVWIWQRLSL